MGSQTSALQRMQGRIVALAVEADRDVVVGDRERFQDAAAELRAALERDPDVGAGVATIAVEIADHHGRQRARRFVSGRVLSAGALGGHRELCGRGPRAPLALRGLRSSAGIEALDAIGVVRRRQPLSAGPRVDDGSLRVALGDVDPFAPGAVGAARSPLHPMARCDAVIDPRDASRLSQDFLDRDLRRRARRCDGIAVRMDDQQTREQQDSSDGPARPGGILPHAATIPGRRRRRGFDGAGVGEKG